MLMKSLLICPSERSNVKLLAERLPLANLGLLGQSLLEYWLSNLAGTGVRQVAILAHDRPEYVEALVGNGARWGLTARVVTESRELTPAQALLKYEGELNATPLPNGIVTLDHFPGQAENLFNSYSDLFSGVMGWMPRALTADRVGYRESQPGIWTGLHAHISPEAKLRGPCWIGNRSFIGAGAVVGPHAVIEDGCFIEPAAEVVDSVVGVDTFVGRYTEIKDSIACGNTLANWRTNSVAVVPDAFVLCALRHPRPLEPNGWFARVLERCSRNKEELQLFWKHFLMNKEG
jgi:NDP-sugar pyrophosphorylase family protein